MTIFKDLPNDILKEICSHSKFQDTFSFATTNREYWDIINQFQFDQTYELRKNNLKLKIQFIKNKVQHIKTNLDPIPYKTLQRVLINNFTNLKSLDLSDLNLTYQKSSNLIDIINILNYPVSVIVPAYSKNHFIKKNNKLNYSQIDVNAKIEREEGELLSHKRGYNSGEANYSKRIKINEDNHSNRSAPDFIITEEEKTKEHKKRVKEALRSSNTEVANIVKKFGKSPIQYSLCISLDFNTNITNKSDLEEAVSKLGQKFVEAVFVSSEKQWLLVTQVEIYYKDIKYDDCSNSWVSQESKTPRSIELVVEQKGDINRWVEVKVYHGLFEVVVTGGLHGIMGEDDDQFEFEGFLGPSAPTTFVHQSHWLMFIPSVTAEVETDVRLLRNFKKRDSLLKWSFKSRRFLNLNFSTTSPFALPSNAEIFYKVASYLIKASSEGSININHLVHCQEELVKNKYWKVLGFEEEADVKLDDKMSKTKKWMIENILEKKVKEVYYGCVNLYTQCLYHKLKNINRNKLKEFKLKFYK